MGFREDLSENRGATSDVINALGTYKFKSKKPRNGQGNEAGGGVFAPGTDKERAVSAEDAVRFSPLVGRFAASAWRGMWTTMISGCSLAGTSSTRTVSTNGSR
jgi:hypothetical protein